MGETMDIKNKRDFLKGFGMVSAGVVAAGDALAQGRGRADVPNEGGYPPGVPKATGRSMLDSPHYIGEASKGYGFKANWARTLPMVPTVDPNYKPRRINKAIELWEDNQVVAYAEFGASGAPDTYEEGKRMAKTWCDAINYEMENDSSTSTACATSCRAWSMAVPHRPGTARRWCSSPCRPGALTVLRCAPMCGRSPRRWRRARMAH